MDLNKFQIKKLVSKLQEIHGQDYINKLLEDINPPINNNKPEPILDPNNTRYTAFPINYPAIWQKYKEQMANFWKAEEIDFSMDYEDFLTLSDGEKIFIENILAFFAASDGIVNFNLAERFINEIQITEAKFAYQFQAMMENIHCVAGDTKILTNTGYIKIQSVVNKSVRVWNGREYSETYIRYTGDHELYRVILSNGMVLDTTSDHKFFIKNPDKQTILAKDLKIGQIIYPFEYPAIINSENFPQDYTKILLNPYLHGFCIGMGITKNKIIIPYNYPTDSKIHWLEGLADAIPNSHKNQKWSQLKFPSENINLLRDIQLLLTSLRINSNIKTIQINKKWELIINSNNMVCLINLGFKPKITSLDLFEFIRAEYTDIKIQNIILLPGLQPTYCFHEKHEHAGIFNGILTGQSEVYSLMLDNIVKDKKKHEFLFNAIKTVPAVKSMADFAFKWIESDKPFAFRVVAFAIVEGIFFSGAFAAIFWLKKYKNENRDKPRAKPFMNGLIISNKFIARDEGLHFIFACEIYNLLENKLTPDQITEIVSEGCQIAKNFMIDALPIKLIGMNSVAMADYIEYISDRLLISLGYKKIYNKINPFKFMETIGLLDKTNFFEQRPHEYQSSHVLNPNMNPEFNLDEDF